ncbi:50S ribosomal protein L5 [archaeon]|jgi:large subunit ribosomal protein L5|nr:50S ribosomal protein L5 [archaeon]MBT4351312.1 50S ribosomal protein L5 [archaeon]MBT4646842.1 50S ribosomal protein L5 [archaeon]MBT6822087.1 50S ribosomal protein L5 [archaeon]MBT7392576.1 50S ribosomal protein L5 [archaeon]
MNKIQQLRIEKITLNIGAGTDQKLLEKGMKLIKNLTGISPIKTKTLKRIPAWGLRPNLPIGCKLTLRGEKAIEILKRLIVAKKNVLKSSCFDSNGNLSFGVHEYIDIPDLEYSPEIGIIGLQIAVTVNKPGTRVMRRKIRKNKIGPRQKVTQKESIDYFTKEFNIKLEEKNDN